MGHAIGVCILSDSQWALCIIGPLTSVFLARSGSHTPKEYQVFTWNKDHSYLANLTKEALGKELSSMMYYIRRASVILTIGGASHYDAFLNDRGRKG